LFKCDHASDRLLADAAATPPMREGDRKLIAMPQKMKYGMAASTEWHRYPIYRSKEGAISHENSQLP
jgi:predicted restriction endonuclease